jgi:hypothetical protein
VVTRYGPHRPEDVPEDLPTVLVEQRERLNTLAYLGGVPEQIHRTHERIEARATAGLSRRAEAAISAARLEVVG